jgi:hypothetical protein
VEKQASTANKTAIAAGPVLVAGFVSVYQYPFVVIEDIKLQLSHLNS